MSNEKRALETIYAPDYALVGNDALHRCEERKRIACFAVIVLCVLAVIFVPWLYLKFSR